MGCDAAGCFATVAPSFCAASSGIVPLAEFVAAVPVLGTTIAAAAPGSGGCQPGGGVTWTKFSHLGQPTMSPTSAGSDTLSRARQVVH